jgi:site-specific DNA recombinase
MIKETTLPASNSNQLSHQAVLYARVSSKEQEREGFSIASQLRTLRGYAKSKDLTIVQEFVDAETAKHSGRTQFTSMITFLKDNAPNCRIILVEKTDRLYRNIRDWVTLDDLDLEIHLVKENERLSADSQSHAKLVHGFKVLMAKNYVDNLSEEVRKGQAEKVRKGLWPSVAPLGYRNNREAHTIEPDPIEAPLIARLFNDAADGHYSLKEISNRAYTAGLRSRRSQGRLTVEGVRRILANPIYWGPFRWNKQLYAGVHEPLISKQLFDRVNKKASRRGTPRRRKHRFAFTGLLTCSCGKRLVGQMQKGKYVYYACSAYCGTSTVSEKKLSAMYLEAIKRIQISPEVADYIRQGLISFESDRRQEHEKRVQHLQQRRQNIQRRIDNAYDDKLSGAITQKYWDHRSSEWQVELAEVSAEIHRLESATFKSFDDADAILELAQRAPELFVKQNPTEQARLLKFIALNSCYDGATLSVTYKKPFDLLTEELFFSSCGADETRTRDLWLDRPAF